MFNLIAARTGVLWIVIALTFGVGCSQLIRPPGAPKTKEKLVVVRVTVEGVKSVDKEELVEGLGLRAPHGVFTRTKTLFDETSMVLDKRRIETFYRTHGYMEAQVVHAETHDVGHGEVAVHYVVEEGQPTSIAQVQFIQSSDHKYSEDDLRKLLSLHSGSVFLYDGYEEGKKRLVHFLAQQGHAFARVTGQVLINRKDRQAEISYLMEPGPKVQFGKTTIHGTHRIPNDAIRARLQYQDGDTFSPDKLRESRDALYSMGLLSSVHYDYDRTTSRTVADLDLQIREGSRNELKIGPGIGIDNARYEGHLRFEYVRRSFLLPLATLRVSGKPRLSHFRSTTKDTPFGGEAIASMEFIDLPVRFLSLRTSLAYTIDDFAAYSGRGPKVAVSLHRDFFNTRLQLSGGWNWSYQTLSRIDDRLTETEQALVGLVSPYRVGSFVQRITYDSRDRPLAATRGLYFQMAVEEAGNFSGSDFGYVRVTPDVRGYWSLLDRLVAAARFKMGTTLYTSDRLPISQRYFVGGSASHRGFSIQRLSPRGGMGRVPIGGEAMIDTSFELRYALAWCDLFDVITFLDGADVFESSSQLSPSNLHWAVGGGLRVRTPVGPVRLDVGYRLNRQADIVDDTWAWHLGLGEAF